MPIRMGKEKEMNRSRINDKLRCDKSDEINGDSRGSAREVRRSCYWALFMAFSQIAWETLAKMLDKTPNCIYNPLEALRYP